MGVSLASVLLVACGDLKVAGDGGSTSGGSGGEAGDAGGTSGGDGDGDGDCNRPEICNGEDDDCNDAIDEAFEDKGDACSAGVGACEAEGTLVCNADGSATECDAEPGEPSDELCGNDVAEDCDGELDNRCTVEQVALGNNFTCALIANGTVRCFGRNADGQLGRGVQDDDAHPEAATVLELSNVKQVAAGAAHACAARHDNTVLCWGDNSKGQLGLGEDTTRSTPAALSLTNIESVATGSGGTCANDFNTGDVLCWRANTGGELGTGAAGPDSCDGTYTIACNQEPSEVVDIGGVLPASAISMSEHVCALVLGSPMCWGFGDNGQLGIGEPTFDQCATLFADRACMREPTSVDLDDVVELAAADSHSCAVVENGDAYCWGYASGGRLGNGESSTAVFPSPVRVDAELNFERIVAGNATPARSPTTPTSTAGAATRTAKSVPAERR